MRSQIALFILALLLTCYAYAKDDPTVFSYPVLKTSGISIMQFIPKGWHVLLKATGDLNGDKLPDCALIIEYDQDVHATHGEQNAPADMHKPRIFLILFARKTNGYLLSVQSNDLIKCADEGGIFGDPLIEGGIAIEHGAVLVHHYGGSAWRWDIKARFRFQHNGWYLIGLTDLFYWDGNNKGTVYDYNLMTGKMSAAKGNVMLHNDKKSAIWTTPGKQLVFLTHFQSWYDGEWQRIADHDN